jgi:hypothetical protein
MTMVFKGFTAVQEQKLRKALEEVRTNLRTTELPPDLASLLRLRLANTKEGEYVGVTYRGNDARCSEGSPPAEAYGLGHHNIFLCAKAFRATTLTATHQRKRRLPAILFHELVHTCGGNEVDAETFENCVFGGEGATLPDMKDLKERFKEVDFKGRWVEMNPRTGEVTRRDTGRLLITFSARRRREK